MVSSAELVPMVEVAGIRQIITYGTLLGYWIADARKNPEILRALRSLTDIWYGGIGLEWDLETWALENGIRVNGLFACTESCSCFSFFIHI